jgi:hypothetical protein
MSYPNPSQEASPLMTTHQPVDDDDDFLVVTAEDFQNPALLTSSRVYKNKELLKIRSDMNPTAQKWKDNPTDKRDIQRAKQHAHALALRNRQNEHISITPTETYISPTQVLFVVGDYMNLHRFCRQWYEARNAYIGTFHKDVPYHHLQPVFLHNLMSRSHNKPSGSRVSKDTRDILNYMVENTPRELRNQLNLNSAYEYPAVLMFENTPNCFTLLAEPLGTLRHPILDKDESNILYRQIFTRILGEKKCSSWEFGNSRGTVIHLPSDENPIIQNDCLGTVAATLTYDCRGVSPRTPPKIQFGRGNN